MDANQIRHASLTQAETPRNSDRRPSHGGLVSPTGEQLADGPEHRESSRKRFDFADSVRQNTAFEVNERFDRGIIQSARMYAGQSHESITRRLDQLEAEWDVGRVLETFASSVALTGLYFSLTRSRLWLVLPFVYLSFLIQHAVQGWSPPLVLLRSMGFRTRSEIDAEKTALKALRGDFAKIGADTPPNERAALALRAAGITADPEPGIVLSH